jgi:hypothetical protein
MAADNVQPEKWGCLPQQIRDAPRLQPAGGKEAERLRTRRDGSGHPLPEQGELTDAAQPPFDVRLGGKLKETIHQRTSAASA